MPKLVKGKDQPAAFLLPKSFDGLVIKNNLFLDPKQLNNNFYCSMTSRMEQAVAQEAYCFDDAQ